MRMSSTDLGTASQKPSASELPSNSSSAASSASASWLRARQPFDIDKVFETAWRLPDGLDVMFRDVVTGHALEVWSKKDRILVQLRRARTLTTQRQRRQGKARSPASRSRRDGNLADNPRRNSAVTSTLDVKGRTPDAALCQASGIPAHGVRRRRVPETLDAAYGPWP